MNSHSWAGTRCDAFQQSNVVEKLVHKSVSFGLQERSRLSQCDSFEVQEENGNV